MHPSPKYVVALEEHFTLPFVPARIGRDVIQARGFGGVPVDSPHFRIITERLSELGQPRVDDMDENGITIQILSASGPGADLVEGKTGIDLARDMNDALADVTRNARGRLLGFAHLPMRSPDAAARELERAVRELGFKGALINGTTDGHFLDSPQFDPILSTAEELDVPIYLHPHLPPVPVHTAYFSGLPEKLAFGLSTAGWGWHQETALHVLRLAATGVLDRHPRLKIIVGHLGEGLPAMLERCDAILNPLADNLTRRVSETILSQVWITTSGFLYPRPFLLALMAFGVDRVMFSIDYPYTDNSGALAFLNTLPVSLTERDKIAFGNAAALLRLDLPPDGGV